MLTIEAIMFLWEIFIFCTLCSVKVSICEPIDCLYDPEDYISGTWDAGDPLLVFTSNNSENLPANFRGKPGLRSGNGIIYFDGNNMTADDIPSVYKLPDDFEVGRIGYIYIKYYAHVENPVDQEAKIWPIVTSNPADDNFLKLQLTSGFQWIEEYFEINTQEIIDAYYPLEIASYGFKGGDYFFIDTVNVVQGHNITDIGQFASHCPGNIEGPGQSTTTTEITDSTTGTSPQLAVLECIDNSIYFDYYKWDSFPHYNYALTSYDLPDIFQGKLVARGIFFFDESANAPNQQIFKPASHLNDTSPTFLYIKYYAHSNGSGSSSSANSCQQAQAYISPVINPYGNQFKILETSSDFTWREELVEVDTEIALRIGVQLQLSGSSKGDFLFIDEIIFTQGAIIQNSQEIKSLCLPAY